MRTRRRSLPRALIALALAATACGSAASGPEPPSETTTGSPTASPTPGRPSPRASASPSRGVTSSPTSSEATDEPTDGATSPSDDATDDTPTVAPSTPGSPPPPPTDTPTNPGPVDDTPLRVGLSYDRNAGALNNAYGFAGIGQTDQRRALEAIVAYINEHRDGVAGRPLEIVWYVEDQLSGKSQETVAQEMCATYTQVDDPVDVVAFTYIDTLRECLNDAGVPQVGGSVGLSDLATFDRFPMLVELHAAALDRLGSFWIDQLGSMGYYQEGREGPGAVVGILAYDEPVFDQGVAAMEAALRDQGIDDPFVVQIRRAQSNEEIADEVRQIQSAVLTMQTAEVTHMHFLGTPNAFMQLMFWTVADTQRFWPRYGLSSGDKAQALIPTLDSSGGEGTSTRTFEMALGVGWAAMHDVPLADYTGDDESERLRLCKEVLEAVGETFGGSDTARNKEYAAATFCDSLFYVEAAVEASGQPFSAASWLAGVNSLSTMPSAYTFDMGTSAERHDAMSAVRQMTFFEDCTCFHYTSDQIGV